MSNYIFPANMAERGPKGETGAKGNKGDKGDRGAAFTFDDFTPEQLASITSGIEAEVTATKDTAIAAITTKSAQAVSTINGVVSSAENDIYTALDTLEVGVDTITNAVSEGVSSIESAESSALSAIESKVSDSESTLDSYTDTKKAAVESAGSTAVNAVNSAKTEALAAVSAEAESVQGFAQKAQNYADTASDNADAAGTAKDTAVTAKNTAVSAKDTAVSSAAIATAAQSAAEAAQASAESAAESISASSAQIETNRTEIIRVEGKVESGTSSETAVTVSSLPVLPDKRYISGAGLWTNGTRDNAAAELDKPESGWTSNFVYAKAKTTRTANLSFLTDLEETVDEEGRRLPHFCAKLGQVKLEASEERTIPIPSDCNYIVITRQPGGTDYTPTEFKLINKAYGEIEATARISDNELAIADHETRIAALEDAFAELCEVILNG